MKYTNYRDKTFDVCIRYYKNQSAYNLRKLKANLVLWTKDGSGLEDYGYGLDGNADVLLDIHYCSDRMNRGRALAILRQLGGK
jgi:hypothetical protein